MKVGKVFFFYLSFDIHVWSTIVFKEPSLLPRALNPLLVVVKSLGNNFYTLLVAYNPLITSCIKCLIVPDVVLSASYIFTMRTFSYNLHNYPVR